MNDMVLGKERVKIMMYVRGGKRAVDFDPDLKLAEMVSSLLDQMKKEEVLCPKFVHDTGGYNSVCHECGGFSNFEDKEHR